MISGVFGVGKPPEFKIGQKDGGEEAVGEHPIAQLRADYRAMRDHAGTSVMTWMATVHPDLADDALDPDIREGWSELGEEDVG